ncbi:inorganic diphosphatase [Sphingobacterium sp. DK4209]|uniref:Inorganic pyrophosphatase n=1 Tax=Sphingobacterium zhuxiongii TaxID=2662364 RepID=A0A5Q0QDK8_9SPHI|nr:MULTISPECIES: inorganic diphosphatase [unclassified Sphingobacterium]MVZ66452.1 inorganic diphosphatase [Sphingobacterium sp. DK4209]QGA27299.1 inorganic diphosphatase [Sphingobacterium sp. dk4302]
MDVDRLWTIALLLFVGIFSANAQQHPWHQLSPGKEAPKVVTAVIEITKGSRAKYEIDKTSGLLKLDRVLNASVVYPTNYGFIPQSYCGDSDPLDILVLCSQDLAPYSLVDARVIGVMRMLDSGDQDDKIIAVAHQDAILKEYNDLSDLPSHIMKEISHFFQTYKSIDGKSVKIENISGQSDAQSVILESLEHYKTQFGNKDLTNGN